MTKKELTIELSKRAGISKNKAIEIIDIFFDVIIEKVISGERVVLPGLGIVKFRTTKEHKTYNPRMHKHVIIPNHTRPYFTLSPLLRKKFKENRKTS